MIVKDVEIVSHPPNMKQPHLKGPRYLASSPEPWLLGVFHVNEASDDVSLMWMFLTAPKPGNPVAEVPL